MTVDVQSIKHAASRVSPDIIKEHLPILFVLEANEHYPAREEAGRFKFYSPFRADSDPSFDVFTDGKGNVRWGDYAEGKQGDVIDLVGRFFELKIGRAPTFTERIDECRKYLEQMQESGWSAPTLKPRKTFDLEAAKELYASATAEPNVQLIELFLTRRSDLVREIDADWLMRTFDVGAVQDRLILPYKDTAGELVAYKHRILGGPTMAPPGSGIFDATLYGLWLDDGQKPVVLCEGETDTWVAKWQLGDAYTVLGLPTGAGAQPKQASLLEGRTVYLAFDGDTAGAKGAQAWTAALNATVLLVPVPEGKDLAECPNIIDMLSRASIPTVPPDDAFEIRPNGYYRRPQGPQGQAKHVSNWTFTPLRILAGEDGAAVYEGRVSTKAEDVVLTTHDLLNGTAAKRWSGRHGGSWFGSDTDAQILLAMLQAQAVFLPAGRMTQIAGLHDGQFVWPGGQLGHDRWAYVPPVNDARIAGQLVIDPAGKWRIEDFFALRNLHRANVTDPILAWLAMAPLRPLMPGRQFPVLAITGGSGTGKTTLTETMVRFFSGSSIQLNLTSTTPHAVDSYISSTNAFPVHFDEYRPGARKEAIERLNQLLRDVYTMQPSARGGMNRANVSEVSQLVPSAPIVVTGEDAFHETSHTERMVLVPLPKDGRNPQALAYLQSLTRGPFAHAYLRWLHERYIEDGKTQLTLEPAGPNDLPSRVRYNIGVLHYGWDLIRQFHHDHGATFVQEPDFSLVVAEAVEAASSNPIRDAILWARGESDLDTGVYELEHGVGINPETFVAYINRKGTFTLPGGAKAVRKFLIDHYEATSSQVSLLGRYKHLMVVAAGRIG